MVVDDPERRKDYVLRAEMDAEILRLEKAAVEQKLENEIVHNKIFAVQAIHAEDIVAANLRFGAIADEIKSLRTEWLNGLHSLSNLLTRDRKITCGVTVVVGIVLYILLKL